jgi:hypothetical protein
LIPGTPVSSTTKTDRHDITEILLDITNVMFDDLLWFIKHLQMTPNTVVVTIKVQFGLKQL